MLTYYIFLASMIAILAISSYSYEKINTVTNNSDVSQKLVLSTLIISSIIIFFSFFLRFVNYISYERGSNMLSFGTLVTSILLMLFLRLSGQGEKVRSWVWQFEISDGPKLKTILTLKNEIWPWLWEWLVCQL